MKVVGSIPGPCGLHVRVCAHDSEHDSDAVSLVFCIQHCKRGRSHREKRRSHPSHSGGDRGRGPYWPDIGGAGPPHSVQELCEGVPP